jgi:4a-hydroxytetrahydrobiopterin dehydratase
LELAKTDGWRLRGRNIMRTFVFEDFVQSLRFVNRVARQAESMNHHPDILIQYNKVRLVLTTHDEGGLTMKDFNLARKINPKIN